MVTDEELQEATNDVKNLSSPSPSGPLPEQEVRHREMILLRQLTAYKIKDAKEKGNSHREFSLTINYGLLTSIGEKHPFLMMLIKGKSGIGI